MSKAEKWVKKKNGRGTYLGWSPAECVALDTAWMRDQKGLYKPESEFAALFRAGADAIEKLAKVEEALQAVLPQGVSLKPLCYEGKPWNLLWNCCGEDDYNNAIGGNTVIDALLAAHKVIEEGK